MTGNMLGPAGSLRRAESAAPAPPARAPRRGLLQVVGVWEGAAVGIGVAIGAGIFRTPGYVASYLDAPWKVLAVWALGAFIVLGDCLVLSELAGRVPRAGGWYVYIERGWGRFPAFVYGWVYLLIIDPASSAALVVVLGEYLGALLGWGPAAGRLAGIGVTLGLFGLCLAGVRVGTRVQDALTYTKLAALVVVGLLALLLPAAAPVAGAIGAAGAAGAVHLPRVGGLLAVALALQGVLWTFEGYANTTTMTEESIDPRRVLPRALILGGLALGVTYLVVNAAYLHVLGRDALAVSQLPAADVAERLVGQAGQGIFLVVAIFVALGSLNGAVLSAPRVAYALSRSGLAPEPLTRVTRRGTPDLATLWFAVAWTLYAWFGSFEGLVAVSVFIGALANVMVTAALFRLRRERVGEDEPAAGRALFHCPAYPLLPLGMLLFWTAFAAAVLYDQKWKVGYGLAVTAVAAPVYLWMSWRRGGKAGRARAG